MNIKLQEIIDKEEDWNEDYCTDYGPSAQCPKCNSEDVSSTYGEAFKDRIDAHYYECDNCGHKSDWWGDHDNVARKKYGHPNKESV